MGSLSKKFKLRGIKTFEIKLYGDKRKNYFSLTEDQCRRFYRGKDENWVDLVKDLMESSLRDLIGVTGRRNSKLKGRKKK